MPYGAPGIRRKLFAGWMTVIFCSLVSVLAGVYGIYSVKGAVYGISGNLFPAYVAVSDIERLLWRHHFGFTAFINATGAEERRDKFNILDEVEGSVRERLSRLSKSAMNRDEEKLFGGLSSATLRYLDEVSAFILKSGEHYGGEPAGADIGRISERFERVEAAFSSVARFCIDRIEDESGKAEASFKDARFWLLSVSLVSILLAVAIMLQLNRMISDSLQQTVRAVQIQQKREEKQALIAEAIAEGSLDDDISVEEPFRPAGEFAENDELGVLQKSIAGMSESGYRLDKAFVEMMAFLRQSREFECLHSWHEKGHQELNAILRGDKPLRELAQNTLKFMIEYLGASVGAFYTLSDSGSALEAVAWHAPEDARSILNRIIPGEGISGQAALERRAILLKPVPPGYLRISSALGSSDPVSIALLPLHYDDDLLGLIELASFRLMGENELEFLNQSMEGIAIAISVNRARSVVHELLERTQEQAEELRSQQMLLQQSNEELEERAILLEEQREEVRSKNVELERKSSELHQKAVELERASAYKSEFLANMSHELRTPLNSLMILSGILKENREGNLTEKQVEFAATINNAGRDLLNLINDILDLSKIESGHMELRDEEIALSTIVRHLESIFLPVAAEKKISFAVRIEESAPETISSDSQKLLQILKNILSNACKFTSHGGVLLSISAPDEAENPLHIPAVAFRIEDTGIGIPEEQQPLVFNAFHQVDGGSSRIYGGTGLGLSISSRLAYYLGGKITLSSEPGRGSVFTLFLPESHMGELETVDAGDSGKPPLTPPMHGTGEERSGNGKPAELPLPMIPDDRNLLSHQTRSILVIEDDIPFASILLDMIRKRGFMALLANDGANGIAAAERYSPDAIILDVMLPHTDGWGVMRSLKDNPLTRHVPVHFITCLEERNKAMSMGAIGFMTKPVTSEELETLFARIEKFIEKRIKKLLIVASDAAEAESLSSSLDEPNISITVAESGQEGLRLLAAEEFDCMVLCAPLSGIDGFELLEQVKKLEPEMRLPVILHNAGEIETEEEKRVNSLAESLTIKGSRDNWRLLDEVSLFLHQVESSLDPAKRRMIRSAVDREGMLAGKNILVVDDDMRNVFSLSSALSSKGMIVHEAANGREALNILDERPGMDMVLMDIMMPEMNGYEAMREIRKDSRFLGLPIIALTAKAMKGDREECLKAGANDYVSKPVDLEKLFSLLRVWLYSPDIS